MRHLFLLLFSLLQLTAFSQGKVTGTIQVDLSNYYTKSQTDSIIKASGGIVKPPVKKPDCQAGPDIRDIRDITPSGATLQFHGEGVDTLQFEVWKVGGSKISSGLIAPKSSVVSFAYPNQTGSVNTNGYTLVIRGFSCKSDDDRRDFPIKKDVGGGVVVPDPVINPPAKPANSTNFGAFITKIAGRTYAYNRTPELELQFNADGTISDVTKNLQTGAPSKLDGQNVFYMLGYSVFTGSSGEYIPFKGVFLEDGAYTVKQFVCRADKIPDLAAFIAGQTGWGDRGVNQNNVRMSEITLSITSDKPGPNVIVPRWLTVSRVLNMTKNLPEMDWTPYNKSFSLGYVNKGDAQSVYQRIGIQPYINLSDPTPQPNTWHTIKSNYHGRQPDSDLYGWGRHFMERMGSDFRSVFTSELGENAQGQDPDVYGRVQLHYKGAFDVLNEKYGNVNPLYTGLFGDYGADDFSGYFNIDVFHYGRADYERSLTDKIHKGYGALSNGDFGFKPEDHEFYTRKHIDVRNLNHKQYFWNHIYNLPADIIYVNEKAKLGTKTWQGLDRERKVGLFTTVKIESFVMDNNGNKINPEQARTGEIIPYKNGEILTRQNLQPPAPWEEMFTQGFWGMLITGGIQIWDAPGSVFGQDSTKLHWWTDQGVFWKPKGANEWEKYESSRNGAPENSSDGLIHSLYSSGIDASAAGMQVAYEIRNRTKKLSHTGYKSSRGEFIAQPGTTGFHLNGFGPINWKNFSVRDAVDQKKAICLIGEGPEGSVIIFYNGSLSANNFEDDVIVRHAGQDYNLGRIHFRQTVIRKL